MKDVSGKEMKLDKFIHTGITESDANGWFVEDKVDGFLQINEAIDVRIATTYEYSGYKFLGWGKSADDSADTLFLKWDAENSKFLAKDEAGNWTIEAKQVAADEKQPYDDLYAIWEAKNFYIYHSSTQEVDTVSMADLDENGKYDITSKVTDGYMYGGYYKDYAKKGTYTGGPTATKDGTSYEGGLGYWNKKMVWGSSLENGEGGIGTAMTPVAEQTYYLKEVPEGFLASKIYVIYDAYNNNKVVYNYLISDVDDNNYSEIGLVAKNISTGNRIKLAVSYTINDTFNGKTDKITAKNSFGMKAGYVAVWQPTLATKDFDIAATYTTPDGVTVEGSYIRMITVGDGTYKNTFAPGNGGFAIEDTPNTFIRNPGHISTREE